MKKVNLKKYQGKWWEIAKKPAIFQTSCISDTNANYELKEGYVEVENKCKTIFGIPQSIKGKAFPTDDPNVLQVQFFPLLPRFDNYKIEWVDRDYQYVVKIKKIPNDVDEVIKNVELLRC